MSITRIPATPAARTTIWCLGIYAIAQGTWMTLDSPARLGGPAFTLMRELPHAHIIWGLWAFAAGVVILTGSRMRLWRLKGAGLLALSAWSTCLSVSALTASFTIPTSGTTGGPTYLLIAFLAAIVVAIDESSP